MLLVLSAVPLLVTQTVSSQSLTTITSWTTVTNQSTSTSYSTFVVATTTQTSTVTMTSIHSFSLPAADPQHCYYNYAQGTFKAGDRLVGLVTSSTAIDFYLMSTDQFSKFPKVCGRTVSSFIDGAYSAVSHSFDLVVSADGVYYFVMDNYGAFGSSQGGAEATGVLKLQYPGSQSVTLTLYSTLNGSNVFVNTQTSGSPYYSTVTQPFAWITENPVYLILGIVIVVSIVIVGALVVSGLRMSRPTAVKAKRQVKVEATKKAEKETQFCMNCGAELPLKSKFCNKCGSAQDLRKQR